MKNTTVSIVLRTLALACVLMNIGCLPPPPLEPPVDVFSPGDGNNFLSPVANINLISLGGSELVDGAVCATTDGSAPALDGTGGCAAGSLVTDLIVLSCTTPNVPSSVPVLEDKTVNIVFGWGNGSTASEENRSASYTLDCADLYYIFDVSGNILFGGGVVVGTSTITGTGRFTPTTGLFEFNFLIETAANVMNTTTQGAAEISGLWNDPVLSEITGTGIADECVDHGGVINGCDSIILHEYQPMNIIGGDPITMPMEAGEEFTIVLYNELLDGLVTLDTTYVFTRVAGTATTAQADLVVSSLSVSSWSAGRIDYDYTITNIGDAAANLDGPTDASFDNVAVQAFLSADTVFYNAGDVPAGGVRLGPSPLGYLEPGESFSGSFHATTTVDPAATPYLILMADWGAVVAESDEENNTLEVLVDP
jgi:hypothetical protein